MRSNGFFASILAFILLSAALSLIIATNETHHAQNQTLTTLIDAENAHLSRTLLENNTDRIIQTTLAQQLHLKSSNAIAHTAVNSALATYLSPRAQLYDTLTHHTSPLTVDVLMRNSVTIILITESGSYAEYTFTSTPTQNEEVNARTGNAMQLLFTIPFGYTKHILEGPL